MLDIGKPTGVFASEMTAPYYVFLDAGMDVDVASPLGGAIPVDPQSLKPVLRSEHDDRFLADDDFRAKVTDSLAVGDLDMADYDIVFLAGGWGAAFDFGFSDALADKITEANALGRAIGGVCHGPLGLAQREDARRPPLVEGRKICAVTDKQVHELGIESTPHHPETELRRMGAVFESETRFRDPFANHWVVDGNLVTGQNQNAGPMVARELAQLVASGATTAPLRFGDESSTDRPDLPLRTGFRRGFGPPLPFWGQDRPPISPIYPREPVESANGWETDMSDTRNPSYGQVDHEYGLKLATTDPADDGPVWMVNLMSYHEVAQYGDGNDAGRQRTRGRRPLRAARRPRRHRRRARCSSPTSRTSCSATHRSGTGSAS